MIGRFHIEPGKCYCLTTDGITICFKVTGWNGKDYDIETFDGKPIKFNNLTKDGLSEDFELNEISCNKY